MTAQYPDLAAALPKAIANHDAVLDGEIIALDVDGRPSFQELQSLATKLVPLEQPTSPFDHGLPDMSKPRSKWQAMRENSSSALPHYVKPVLICEVTFAEVTRDGTLRHPSFQGLRDDKHPSEVVREET